MIYPQNIEDKIDFGVIRTLLLGQCASPMGKEEVERMGWQSDIESIRAQLEEGEEMRRLLTEDEVDFPNGEIHDMREALGRVRVDGLFLSEGELWELRKTLDYANQLEVLFGRLDRVRYPILSGWHIGSDGGNKVLGQVTGAINRILDKYGQIKDNASPEMARIRKEMSQAQGSVSRAINQILRQAQQEGLLDKDTTATVREGRLVLPIPPGIKKKIGGIVHDESATGKTIFVEPQQVVEANNHIRQLEGEEKRERIKILVEVTRAIRPHSGVIKEAEQWLGHIDFVKAKAKLAIAIRGIAPEIVNRPTIDWKDARHAILYLKFKQQGKEVVPMSLRLGEKDSGRGKMVGNRVLIISGPNAGGKSVCLKTVALTQYMLQCGLLIPVEENSECGLFKHLMIDIGDEQSISDDLSTYSSHLSNMKAFVRNADRKTLFLIDEAGSGTEPLIGGAIAESVISSLHEKGAVGVVTTHYSNLKHMAENTDGMVNGAMLYDRGALKPLFQLSIGQAGSSFAIEIARQIGLEEQIIQKATELVGEDHIDYDKQLQDIARDKRYWGNKRQNIRQKEKQLEEKIAFYETEIAGLKAKRKEIIQHAKEEASELLEQSNATIERTIREIKEAKADKVKTQQARQQVETMKEKVGKPEKQNVFRDLKDLKVLSKSLPTASSNVINTIRSKKLSFERTLDLRGMRGDEALERLIAYMDDAIMVGAGEVTILHGTGTGALKQITRDYLKKLTRDRVHPIQSYRDGDPNCGGAGLTIVEL